MGNRSKYVAVTAAAAAALAARRRARLRRAAEGIQDTILPTHVTAPASDTEQGADEAHAPGHAHLPISGDERRPERVRSRPWARHMHGMRHPFSGD